MAGILKRLPRRFFARPAPVVARELVGMLLVHDHPAGRCGGIVVETEAYDESDPASHAFRGRKTARNAVMFGPAGHAYVYFSYGAHWCLNAVTGRKGTGEAVLIRAVHPSLGIAQMAARRGPRSAPRDVARGPARLTQAMGLDRSHDGADLIRGPLGFYRPAPETRGPVVVAGPRIGITKGVETAWRFCDARSAFLSRPVAQKSGETKHDVPDEARRTRPRIRTRPRTRTRVDRIAPARRG